MKFTAADYEAFDKFNNDEVMNLAGVSAGSSSGNGEDHIILHTSSTSSYRYELVRQGFKPDFTGQLSKSIEGKSVAQMLHEIKKDYQEFKAKKLAAIK